MKTRGAHWLTLAYKREEASLIQTKLESDKHDPALALVTPGDAAPSAV